MRANTSRPSQVCARGYGKRQERGVHREKPDTGKEGLIGMHGQAKTNISNDGQIFVRGEYWNAWSDALIKKGEHVIIIGVEGLRLKVKKME